MANQQLVGYARVSTNSQKLENQSSRLIDHGCQKLFSEQVSGAKSSRKELKAALDYVREGDALVVTKLDRLARSAVDLGKIAALLEDKKVDLVVLDQKIDTSSPTGRLMFTMIGAFAEFERDLISERCREGVLKARARGVRFGRPPKLSAGDLKSLREEFESGVLGKTELAQKYGISRQSIYRLMAS